MPRHVFLSRFLTLLASAPLVTTCALLVSLGCASSAPLREDAAPESTDQRGGSSTEAAPRPNNVCLPDGTACQLPSQCCDGTCANTPDLGMVCKPAGAAMTCLPESRSCKTDQECCTGACISDLNLGRVCKPKGSSQTCRPRSSKCQVNNDCCSGACIQDLALGAVCK